MQGVFERNGDMKQTAVEWLVDKVEDHFCLLPVDLIEQAIEMEKQQIIDAYNYGQQIPPFEYAEKYYEETYVNK
jgi:hypothetical protein